MRHTFWLLILIFATLGIASAQTVQTKESQAKMTPHKALDRLKEGNTRFASGKPHDHVNFRAEIAETGKGQYPFAAIVSCIDARVDTDSIFDLNNGDAFDARVVGGIVDADILGSLEYATEEAGAKLIVVLGHTSCGAVAAACDVVTKNATYPGSIGPMINSILPAAIAVKSDPGDFVTNATKESARRTAAHVAAASSLIKNLVDAGKLKIAAALYDLDTGMVSYLD